jgi:hypothetical protein
MSEIAIPKIQDLYDDVEFAKSNDMLMSLLNQPPKKEWIKIHPYIANYQYLPIDKVEFLLKKIFKKYRIEIIREGVAFNGVYVVVRVWYLNPITNEFDYHDGIGAKELQVKKGSSAADLAMINSGALAMAFPIAKTVAIKDACDHFGSLFGSDLNRKDIMPILPDSVLQEKNSPINKINEELKQELPVITPSEAFDMEVSSPEIVTQAFQEPVLIPNTAPAPPPLPPDDDF